MTETTLRAWARLSLMIALCGCSDPETTERSEAPEPPPAVEAQAEPPPTLRPLPVRPDAVPAPAEARRMPEGVPMDPTGRFASRVIVEGEGEAHPGPYDGVLIHYTAWRAADGHMFDNTRSEIRPRPITVFLPHAFPALGAGIQTMVQGETRRFWFPQDPPEAGSPGSRPEGLIVFDVELVELRPAPAAPASLTEPPADAGRSRSGLRWTVIQPGTGTTHPRPETRVQVRYAAWRAETGELFAGSHVEGRPWRQAVGRMISGLQEGIPLMVAGERRIFWVPSDLAYEGQEGPQGMLVFDVELLPF